MPMTHSTSGLSIDPSSVHANAQRLLWAGFMAILAAGVGFAIRGGIFDNWKTEFNFTDLQLGASAVLDSLVFVLESLLVA